jgi:hypothetical protein
MKSRAFLKVSQLLTFGAQNLVLALPFPSHLAHRSLPTK